MNKYLFNSKEEASSMVAQKIIEDIQRGATNLALPTGNSPILFYQHFTDLLNKEKLSKNLNIFNLDEYHGVEQTHELSFYSFMQKHFYSKLNEVPQNAFIPHSNVDKIVDECENYENLIAKLGGIDIAVIGVGVNGHIAFNEPGTNVNEGVHVVELSPSTIEANALQGTKINKAITMGISNILSAKKIYLLAFGEAKQKALTKLSAGVEDIEWPVSYLYKHKDLNLFSDLQV